MYNTISIYVVPTISKAVVDAFEKTPSLEMSNDTALQKYQLKRKADSVDEWSDSSDEDAASGMALVPAGFEAVYLPNGQLAVSILHSPSNILPQYSNIQMIEKKTSASFEIDRKGDRDILQYTSIHHSEVPKYKIASGYTSQSLMRAKASFLSSIENNKVLTSIHP